MKNNRLIINLTEEELKFLDSLNLSDKKREEFIMLTRFNETLLEMDGFFGEKDSLSIQRMLMMAEIGKKTYNILHPSKPNQN